MKYLPILLLLLTLSACTQDFEDINTNENAPGQVEPEFLLRQVIYGYGDAMAYEGFVAGNLLSQHFSMIDFNLFDRHALSSPQEGGDPWPILYTNLRDNETMLTIARSKPTHAVYEGPALVMKAYLAMILTDLFGDVPYFEAFRARANGVTKPVYDTQEDIYLAEEGIFDNLATAVQRMDAYQGAQNLRGDILFDGDLSGWIRFANSLRIKAAMRISARQDPGSLIQEIVDEGRYLQEGDEDATFSFSAGPPNNYPLSTARIGIFNVFLMSKTAEELLRGAPFLTSSGIHYREALYRPAVTSGEYVGIENGIDAASSITPDNFARPGTIWREASAGLRFNYLTSWETNYWLAEAVLKGYLDGNASAYFAEAVVQAASYWNAGNIPCQGACNQLPSEEEEALRFIIEQKWLASIGNGYEAWTEWRRTGYPTNIRPAVASLNNDLIPVRMPYPSDEQALNFENYQSAAAANNDNSINVPVWWDVE